MKLSQKTINLATIAYNSRREAAKAAGLARHISALLKKAGFTRCIHKNCHTWTEGFNVARVGYCSEVAIYWHRPGHTEDDRKICHAKEAEMQGYLRSKGCCTRLSLGIANYDPHQDQGNA